MPGLHDVDILSLYLEFFHFLFQLRSHVLHGFLDNLSFEILCDVLKLQPCDSGAVLRGFSFTDLVFVAEVLLNQFGSFGKVRSHLLDRLL